MKRSTKLAFSLVLAAALVVPAMAQDNFPDVPANHWAYEALARMKRDGLLVGYPDGLYRGGRPASRYELAVAMHAVYTNLKTQIDGLDAQLKAMGTINPQDIQNLKDQVANLETEVNAMKGWGDDIAALKKATEQFDKELKSLGVDVEAMKKDLGDLQDRVTKLEKKKPAVDISGDLDFWAGTSTSTNGNPGLTENGTVIGHSGTAAIGLGHDLAILHEGAFTATGTNETGPKWKVTAVVGNMDGAGGFGNQSSLNGSVINGYGFSQGPEDVYIQDATVKWDTSIVGLSTSIEAGRVAYELSPYLFKRIDNTPYFSNERWDDGKYRLDGAIFGFNFGGVKLHIWGGNNSNLLSVQGVDLNSTIISNNRTAAGPSEYLYGTGLGYPQLPGTSILGQIDKTAAADATIPLGKNGHINLAYLWLEQEDQYAGTSDFLQGAQANRDELFGGDAEFGFGPFKLTGGIHESDITENTSNVNSHDNVAWNASVKYTKNRYALWGGYRQIDNNYYAPGDWGRLGVLYNPANIKGWQAGGYLHVTHALTLSAHGEWDQGVSNENGETNGNGWSYFNASPFTSSAHITSYDVRLDFNVNPHFSVFGSYEDTRMDGIDANDLLLANLPASSDSEYSWATVGLGYGLSSNAKLNVQYQFSNVGNEVFLNPGLTRYVGGFLTTQLTVKF